MARVGLSCEFERLLGHRQLGEPDRQDPSDAQHQHGERSLDGRDLDHAHGGQPVLGRQLRDRRAETRLQGGEHRSQSEGGLERVGDRVCELVGGVELGLEPVGLVCRALEPQRLEPVARLAADALRRESARERVGVVLETGRAHGLPVVASTMTRPPRARRGGSGMPLIAVPLASV